jgi:hypothetical protein
MRVKGFSRAVIVCLVLGCAVSASAQSSPSAKRYQRLDALDALGPPISSTTSTRTRRSHDEGRHHVRGPGLRDAARGLVERSGPFDHVWSWTKENLRVRGDALFAWKYKTECSTRTRRPTPTPTSRSRSDRVAPFDEPRYQQEALEVIQDIWNLEMLPVARAVYPTAGDWRAATRPPSSTSPTWRRMPIRSSRRSIANTTGASG